MAAHEAGRVVLLEDAEGEVQAPAVEDDEEAGPGVGPGHEAAIWRGCWGARW